MAGRDLKPGNMVQHHSFGVGKVKAEEDGGETLIIDFRSRPEHRMRRSLVDSLQRLPDDGLAALTWDGPEEVQPWVSEAPLKLVALALADSGGRGKAKDIQEKLEGRVVRDPKWATWWKQVQPATKSSAHFRVGKDRSITLVTRVDDVPHEPLAPPAKKTKAPTKKPPSLREWRKWLLSEVDGPPPAPSPTRPVSNALAKISSHEIEPAIRRTIWGAREFLASGSATPTAAERWAEAVSRGSLRWRKCVDPGNPDDLSELTGEILARLTRVAKDSKDGKPYEESVAWLLSAGDLAAQPDQWRRGFARGMWEALEDSRNGVRDVLQASSAKLGRRGQAVLAREIALAAFGFSDPARRIAELDRMVDILPGDDRVQLIRDLMVRSATGASKGRVLDYVANSRHAAAVQTAAGRLSLSVLACMLLEDGQSQFADQASRAIGEALFDPLAYGNDPVWPGLLADGRKRIVDLHQRLADDMERQRVAFEGKLEQGNSQEERLRRQVEGLRSQIAEGREESRLDIRQDMLTVIAETLQSFRRRQYSPKEMLGHVEARLALALQAGGAEEFGTVGDTAPFNPIVHQAPVDIPIGHQVRVVVPGSMVRGKLTGDRILIKARVEHPKEVS